VKHTRLLAVFNHLQMIPHLTSHLQSTHVPMTVFTSVLHGCSSVLNPRLHEMVIFNAFFLGLCAPRRQGH